MALTQGARLGPYEILAPLGAGGMGEVYKAKDTRVERLVALKVLPEEFFEDRESVARFEREARILASLNHPNIAHLYSFDDVPGSPGSPGRHVLAMELADGLTLEERLVKGPMALDPLLKTSVEIASALDAAHRAGIVHRDLKPGNVMLTKSGVKLLDFGLAKVSASPVQPSALTSQPTELPKNLTQKGTILGTFQYMSPEQLEGKEADPRSDIFALGAVLYEMATGKKAFSGTSQASLISSIMKENPPPISAASPMSPPLLDRVVKTCLAKDPEERWQNAADVGRQLTWIADFGSPAGLPAPLDARRKGRERLVWSAFSVAALAALLCGFLLLRQRREPARVFQSSILPPEKTQFSFDRAPMAVSPDGRRIAFVAQPREGASLIWTGAFDAPSAQPLAGTEGASYPFWSPDSRFLGFFTAGKLKRIDASGGSAQTLCDAPYGLGGTWNRDGVILFTPSPSEPIYRVASSGGAASPVTQLDQDQGDFGHPSPFFLPDGRHFLYRARVVGAVSQLEAAGVYLGSLDSKERRLLLHSRSNVAYAPPQPGSSHGHLLFLRDRTLMARPFDAKRLQLTGEAFPVAEHVQFFGATGTAAFSISENGILAYQASAAGQLSQLVWFDRDGKQLESVGATANYSHPRLSHDGRRVAVAVVDPQTAYSDIWLHDLPRRASTRFTFEAAVNIFPIWSPDDSQIVFASNRRGLHDLYQKAASGVGNEEVVLSSATNSKFPTDWSQEGRLIAFYARDAKTKTGFDLWVFSVADRKATPFLSTPFLECCSQFSPDGRWMAYASDESGGAEVYVQSFPASSGKWRISSAGGAYPRWRRDGKEIFYVGLDKRLMAVEIKAGTGFEVGTPRFLFNTQIKRSDSGFQYDVSPDGRRFLINTIAAEEKPGAITVVQNWAAASK
jgi:serine/threonine protein kinase/Tol biopolymer transport system component